MMKRVVLLLLVLIVAAVMAQQSSPVPTEAPQPATSAPQSGSNPMGWDNITPTTSSPSTGGQETENPFASENPVPPTAAPTTSSPPPQTSAPPPPPQTSAPPTPTCPRVICPPPLDPPCSAPVLSNVILSPTLTCSTCDYCRDNGCPRRPLCNSPELINCKELIVNRTANGFCDLCPVCWDCPAPTGCEPVPAECVNRGVATFISPVGRPCEGCPVCRDNECPKPERCPPLGDDCIKIEKQTVIINNLTCPACPICTERKVCPPASNCSTIPADCLQTVIDKVTVDGMECDGCPRCTLYRCPTPTCEAIRPQCKNITNTTFVYNGQTCPGCQRCDDVCPPLPTCPAIPADCLKIEQRTRDIDGMTCPDCPVCTERPPQCPPPGNCSEVPASCKNVTTLTFMFQGLVCPGCKQCEDCPIPSNCTAIKPGCANVTYETVTVNGKTCQGCPKCNDPTCPAIKCPCVPKGCTSVVEKWQIINGVKCPACPDISLCNPCPAIKCAPKDNCTELKETTFEFNGKKCPGCPECVIKCPVPKCPALPSNCSQTVDTFFEFQGLKCLGCPQCKVKECPVPSCPPNNSTQCLKWKTRWYTFDGRKCPGCPKCVEFPCKNKCAPIYEGCNKTATIMTHVGDMKCPCKICVDTPTCPNLPCHPIDRSQCKNVIPSYFNYKGMKCRGCDECVKYQCPTIKCKKIADESKCLAVEKTTFKFHNLLCVGCDRCIPKPKCRHCKCKDKKTVTVEIPKYIVKKKFIPYYVFHDTPCNVTKKVHRFEFLQTSKRLRYINVLKYRIKQYRTLVVHFRAVLRKLVVKKTITVESYLNISKIIKQMRHEMENQVRLGSVRLESIEKEMKRVRFLLKKLGERSFSPVSICKRVANKRICGLHPNYFYFNWQVKQGDNAPAPSFKKNFIKHYLWSTVVFTVEPSSVVKINKVNRKKGVVVFTRRSQRWSKRVVKINGFVRNYIWARIIARLYSKSARSRKLIRKYLGFLNGRKLSKEVASVLADPRKKSVVRHLKKHLKKRYNRRIYKVIRKQLKTKAVKALIAKHASTVSVKSYPAKEDQEMMRLPKSIINADGNTLIQLLSAKFKFQ